MVESETPLALVVSDGAMAMDGGSIFLQCLADGKEIVVLLDWSIESCRRGTPQLFVDGNAVPRGSALEGAWLSLLKRAEVLSKTRAGRGPKVGAAVAILGDDIAEYLSAADGLAHLVAQLIAHVRSPDYQLASGSPSPLHAPRDPLEEVRRLSQSGNRVEAVRAYRALYRSISLADAMAAVDDLARGD